MCPGIDAIDADTFQYIFTNETMVGYFDWNLDFKWHAKNDFSWEIYDMPAMSGGLFAIHKKFFETLGFYDPGKLPAPKLTVYIKDFLIEGVFFFGLLLVLVRRMTAATFAFLFLVLYYRFLI